MIHANHFGEFEERCVGAVYVADIWMAWLDTFSDVRNQLVCFLCTVSNLMEMCKFFWAGSALVGIHITEPFMSMLLDHKLTPRQLLTVLPNLCNNLCSYPQPMTNQSRCTLPSLQPYFLHPFKRQKSPYGVPVCQKLKEYIKGFDQHLMDNYLKQVSRILELFSRDSVVISMALVMILIMTCILWKIWIRKC